jgi:mono/diheme cytochrome c family protein
MREHARQNQHSRLHYRLFQGQSSRMIFFNNRLTCASIILAFGFMAPFHAALAQSGANLVEKGKYLTTAGGCVSCHTNPGGEAFAGNREIPTPFGAVYSPNITPDKDTGIGAYTDEQFYKALHDGLMANRDYLYPAMPFTSFTKVKRDDVLAIKAYLFSLKPIHSERKADTLAFPFNIREGMAAWRALFFKPGEFQPDPNKSAQLNRGAYLVEGLAHCGQCHTPRNIAQANESGAALEGAAIQGWYAPNITSDWKKGIGSWSEGDLLSYFKKGVAPGHGIAVGPMAETVHDDLKNLSDDDLKAIVAYLKSTPPKEEAALPSLGAAEAAGALYIGHCASCHQLNGQGLKGKIPALANNGAVKAEGPQDVIRVILGGLPATDTFGPMPSFSAYLDDGQIAAIANYVRTRWGNDAPANADGFLVADLRKRTPLMLVLGQGETQCPVKLTGGAKKVADEANTQGKNILQSQTDDNMVPSVEKLVPQTKKAVPGASPADLVNGLTTAYCNQLAGNNTLSDTQKRSRLNIFSQLVYTEAVAGAIAPPPSGKKASLR